MTPSETKDTLTSAAIIIGGLWAIWRFAHNEWLRRRGEIPSLEGGFLEPELFKVDNDRVAVSLRWTWRNVGSRPVFLDGEKCFVEIYHVTKNIEGFIDPRQQQEKLNQYRRGIHYPLSGYEFYMLEPGTISSLLTIPTLPHNQTFIARHKVSADQDKHPTGRRWNYSWEKWQLFSTNLEDNYD